MARLGNFLRMNSKRQAECHAFESNADFTAHLCSLYPVIVNMAGKIPLPNIPIGLISSVITGTAALAGAGYLAYTSIYSGT
jgi:hypothetical protein